jgi:hypothetical protein
MANKVIEDGNYNSEIHSLKHCCDAFGNIIEPPIGFRMLTNSDSIEETDWHFDIYGGWCQGHSKWHNGINLHCEGRWRGWARKIPNAE